MNKKIKMKSKKAVTRRIKVTKTGKLLRRRSFNRHLKAGKRKNSIRALKRSVQVKGFYTKKLKQILGI